MFADVSSQYKNNELRVFKNFSFYITSVPVFGMHPSWHRWRSAAHFRGQHPSSTAWVSETEFRLSDKHLYLLSPNVDF